MSDFISELQWRGRLAQVTDEAALRKHLATGTRRAYIGFDPTADSLTVGNLVQIITLALIQRSGHVPVVVVGGGTGLIGDPSGKTAERTLRTRDEVNANVESQKRIYDRILDFSAGASNRAMLLNNADWLCELSFLDALRDIGKHFSVNMMIQKDSVRERLHNRDQGISYTEFSYMILQAFDFQYLRKKYDVTIQSGGSDQWGNIVAGTDLIRKSGTPELTRLNVEISDAELGIKNYSEAGRDDLAAEAKNRYSRAMAALDKHLVAMESFGLTTQLITKSDGGKFGKTESGAIWLTANRPGESSPNRTSPYAFYQFWLLTADADIPKFLRTFTLMSHEEIEGLEDAHKINPGARDAHRALARHMTTLLHGETETQNAESAAKALFSGEIANLPADLLTEVLASAPSTSHSKATLSAGIPLVDLLVTTQLAQSKREAKEFLQTGSVTLNGRKVGPDDKATTADLLHNSVIALRRGKKAWHVTRWA